MTQSKSGLILQNKSIFNPSWIYDNELADDRDDFLIRDKDFVNWFPFVNKIYTLHANSVLGILSQSFSANLSGSLQVVG